MAKNKKSLRFHVWICLVSDLSRVCGGEDGGGGGEVRGSLGGGDEGGQGYWLLKI